MIDKLYLKNLLEDEGFSLTEEMLAKFDQYAALLVSWNEKINLTSIVEPTDICIKHFLDSVLLLKAVEVKQRSTMIDVGTGAGFPSVPCKILRDDLSLTLLDSLNKRILFLEEVAGRLEQDTVCVHARAEEFGKKPDFREQFDIATARAVAHLRELSEYCLPFVKVGGVFASLKGYEIEKELKEAEKAIVCMGGRIREIKKYELPGENKRAIVIIEKISQTPTKFPRNTAKMKKAPIQ
ncbi:16S rRNA (guanine(527)-N(7))-methyltransferase RsmG [Massiliimalia timonensis]|uniref:16S rRNA (guanine(527)-N(7))-methyltransferase RsmG n=1 Tax=Massiliimalia timonensis TaxID=1987501 RepID=UPI00189E3E6D|nr:16S rRNA (guanine(527)-N(7))-methyltransferase RsmG [Massiliimalia timonensis]